MLPEALQTRYRLLVASGGDEAQRRALGAAISEAGLHADDVLVVGDLDGSAQALCAGTRPSSSPSMKTKGWGRSRSRPCRAGRRSSRPRRARCPRSSCRPEALFRRATGVRSLNDCGRCSATTFFARTSSRTEEHARSSTRGRRAPTWRSRPSRACTTSETAAAGSSYARSATTAGVRVPPAAREVRHRRLQRGSAASARGPLRHRRHHRSADRVGSLDRGQHHAALRLVVRRARHRVRSSPVPDRQFTLPRIPVPSPGSGIRGSSPCMTSS